MALTALEREAFKRGIAEEAASEEILDIIEGGTAASLSTLAKKALQNALGNEFQTAVGIISALENGSATLTDEQRRDCQRLMGQLVMGNNLVTEIEAVA